LAKSGAKREEPVKKGAKVYLVGAGPGDPDLLTVKAHRLLGAADAVVYDRLVSSEILSLVPPGAMRISVGKLPGHHPVPQSEINTLLVNLARAGHRVVRLKGGDPFVFGRGSEEALHLARHGIFFEVVPGVTSASGCAAAAGIPLTHRGLATGVRYLTGHGRGDQDLTYDWQSLADPDTTLVVYMGVANIGAIADRLMAAGLPGATPVAAVNNGTQSDERQWVTTLAEVAEVIKREGPSGPVLFVIGRVVALSAMLGRQPGADTASGIERLEIA
jgi:uroporphyrin-III C-methyltransferase